VSNFTPVPRHEYVVPLPRAGQWREMLNSDADIYGGSGMGNLGTVHAGNHPSHGQPASARVTLPPMATLFLVYEMQGS